ncbi:MAG: polyhydroxyalkanoic acid system protein [Lautropia sp.]|nr:MAG: polyhydroxyalkanoic acid system protein [Pseudomonadota bacterium]MBC6960930.1 polyhydroxyalkanoic acid system protein [Lautropia sp.]MCL4702520.1 polyhydroxyalkanoic acid system family protein [Burkholderiaceae bacterium]MDL1907663.1 polyhydroxyalkanoic acid system protein [Betaproteobacteria bacterium PRO1]RIK86723.1 MAG: polyhydroxyalkanoic acid system protein [Burkholderiales bacterium]
MAAIYLQRRHALGLKKARQAAQKVADDMAESFAIESEWDGNALRFSRAGVSGSLTVSKDSVVLDAQLGLLLSAFASRIEERLQKDFDRYFA